MTEPTTKRAKIDWETIERLYRANQMSVREIARVHGISDKAIRDKAKELGWERDLTEKIDAKVRTALRTESASADPLTEKQAIEEAVATTVTVVRSHRKRITRQTQLVDLLTAQLINAATDREDLEEAIEEETANDKTGERRARMMKAVSLSTHASTAVNLSNALKTLIGLERQAFNIKDESEGRVDALATLIQQIGGTSLPVVPDAEGE